MNVLIALCTLALAAPQVTTTTTMPPQAPPRDTSAQAKGTASIKGKVVTAEGGRPMRRVQISASARELGETRSVSTNTQGVFEITELPAGRYTLTASRGGYLRLQYGQRHPGESGRPIQLDDKQAFTGADFALPRASTIVGRVTDEIGDPLANASIFPMQWRFFRGQRRLVPVSGGGPFNRTDDTGGYRITGLEPGDYFVMATTRDAWTDEQNPKEKIGFPADVLRGHGGPGERAPCQGGARTGGAHAPLRDGAGPRRHDLGHGDVVGRPAARRRVGQHDAGVLGARHGLVVRGARYEDRLHPPSRVALRRASRSAQRT